MPDSFVKLELSPETKKYFSYAVKHFDREEVYREIDTLFTALGLRAAGHISKNFLSGQKLGRRTGNLARSVVGGALRVHGVPAVRVGILTGPALPYAGVQEVGTKRYNSSSPFDTIRPKNAKSLAMPVNSSLTRAGVARYLGPRNDPRQLKFIPFRRGIAVGALYPESELKKLKRNRLFTLRDLRAAYILLRQVDIKPKFYLRDGFTEFLPVIEAQLGQRLRAFIAGKESSNA